MADNAQIAKLEASATSAKNDLTAKQNALASAEQQLAAAMLATGDLRKQLAGGEARLATLTKKRDAQVAAGKDATAVNAEIKTLQRQIDNFRPKVKAAEATEAARRAGVASLADAVKAARERLSNIGKQLAVAKNPGMAPTDATAKDAADAVGVEVVDQEVVGLSTNAKIGLAVAAGLVLVLVARRKKRG